MQNQLPRQRMPASRIIHLSYVYAGICILALLTAFFFYWPVARAFYPLEVNRNEAWNAWFIDAAMNGPRLYPGPNELVVNNYPPLSFYLTGWVGKLTGDVIYAGRVIALVSSAVAAFSIAAAARNLGASLPAAAFGALWFLATMGAFASPYVAMNDPAMLALAIMGCGLALFTLAEKHGGRLEPAIAVMVLAGFVKLNVIGIPIAVFVWLLFTHRARALRFAIVGSALVILGLAICTSIYGANFLHELFAPRVANVLRAVITAGRLQWIAPALIFWAAWAWPNRQTSVARFSCVLLAVTIMTSFLQRAFTAVSVNALFEVILVTAIATSLSLHHVGASMFANRWGQASVGRTLVAVLVIRLILSRHPEPYQALFAGTLQAKIAFEVSEMSNHIRQVQAIPGPVNCQNLTVCYRAGKDFVFDRFWIEQFVAMKVLSQDQVRQAVFDAGIRFEEAGVEVPMGAIKEAH